MQTFLESLTKTQQRQKKRTRTEKPKLNRLKKKTKKNRLIKIYQKVLKTTALLSMTLSM